MKDERELILFERELGDYNIASAIWSYGDVIDFIDGERKGIVIADTTGHQRDFGDAMKGFLKREIASGWGSRFDARTEILDLGQRLSDEGSKHQKIFDENKLRCLNDWWNYAGINYAQLEEKIYLSGLYYLLVRRDGDIETPNSSLFYHHYKNPGGRSMAEIDFNQGDVLLMTSDGLRDNICSTYRCLWQKAKSKMDSVNRELTEVIRKNIDNDVVEIRDVLVKRFRQYFLSCEFNQKIYDSERYDDVTFALIKRRIGF
ncbi:SpoIIE family protein phosphatase [Candidatus Woesearchaeota archaeon]|nr:SpoIIE family protein phosphatase [Candidatus Woesearchaeota archaeon]MBT5739662.1 SpoIIE family protein phosphatase [Candidatus Woesearchaeota archaeon]